MPATIRLPPLLQRWLWFIGLWAGGVVSVMLAAGLLRWVLIGRH